MYKDLAHLELRSLYNQTIIITSVHYRLHTNTYKCIAHVMCKDEQTSRTLAAKVTRLVWAV